MPTPRRGWDVFLVLLVLVLAFFVASFLARNSDLWFHLATGRLLAKGQFTFGVDPFAYTTDQVYWANHAWLFDLALYGLHLQFGGAILVVVKAIFVSVLAGVLLVVRRREASLGVPVLCTALALVAMSPRLLLQPACMSYCFLGLTLWLLWRPHGLEKDRSRGYVLLPLLFVLWVNVDEWFLLGPLVTALFWLGERWSGQRRLPGWVVLAGLAACLLSPYTYRGLTLPNDFSPVVWSSSLRDDPRFRTLFASPFQPMYWRAATEGNAAVWSYYALIALGLLSFLLHPTCLRGWRSLVWVPFAALAAWQARTIPFFAIVAAPITALNWQDYLADRRLSGLVLGTGRLFLALALASLIFLSWPGWLAGLGRQERPVAWGIQADSSLRHAAETLAYWRDQDLLSSSERVFGVHPEVAQYATWFCPEEKHFFDHRFPLFAKSASAYETVCRALEPGLTTKRKTDAPNSDWRRILRDHHVSVVVLYDRDPERTLAALHNLTNDRAEWTLLDVAGSALFLGWNEGRPPNGFAPLAFDAERLAFGPQNERTRRELPSAPERGPEHLPTARTFRETLTRLPAPPSWESAAATAYLNYFNDSQAWQEYKRKRDAVNRFAASLVGLPPLFAAPQLFVSRHFLLPRDADSSFVSREQLGPFFFHLTEQSPALPLLAIRAARLAIAENPEDANAWLRLGQAYVRMYHLTCEHSGERKLPPLTLMRQVQIVTALEQALRLDPELEAAHHELAFLYGDRQYLDMTLDHRRRELQITRRVGRRANEKPEEFAYRLELMDREIDLLEKKLQENRERYASAARPLRGDRLPQAKLALQLGLARQATDEVLLPSAADLLGAAGIKLELELLLTLGRTEEVRTILNDEALINHKNTLPFEDLPPPPSPEGTPLYNIPYTVRAYEWLRLLQTTAVGDYGRAREALRVLRADLATAQEIATQNLKMAAGREHSLLPGLFAGPPAYLPALTAVSLSQFLQDRAALESGQRALRAQRADLLVMEGLLALEQGDTIEARASFAAALLLCVEPSGVDVPFAGRPIAVRYLELSSGQ